MFVAELTIAIVFGLVFGSFISCASYRLPIGMDILRARSFCPKCEKTLSFVDLFPFFSWWFAGGKCRHCQEKISIRYPLIELATAFIFAVLYMKYGFSLQWGVLAFAAVWLLVMIIADFEHYIIPDTVHLVLLPLGFLYRYATHDLSLDIIWSFSLLAGLALLLHYGYSALRGRTMLGFGDVKFMAVAGIWLKLGYIPSFLLVAGVLGVVLGIIWKKIGKGEVFPFAPALAVSLFLCLIFPQLNLLH